MNVWSCCYKTVEKFVCFTCAKSRYAFIYSRVSYNLVVAITRLLRWINLILFDGSLLLWLLAITFIFKSPAKVSWVPAGYGPCFYRFFSPHKPFFACLLSAFLEVVEGKEMLPLKLGLAFMFILLLQSLSCLVADFCSGCLRVFYGWKWGAVQSSFVLHLRTPADSFSRSVYQGTPALWMISIQLQHSLRSTLRMQ